MFNILKNGDMLGRKRFVLSRLTKKSIASIGSIQAATNKLVTINDNIDQTTHEIEEIEASFSLIKGELNQRKANNAAIIAQIKLMGENNGKSEQL